MYGWVHHCLPETTTRLLIDYTPIQNKKFKKKKKKQVWKLGTTVYRQFVTMSVLLTLVVKPSWEWCRVTVLLLQDWSGQRGPQHPTMLFRLVPSWANKERLGQYKEPRKRTRLKWCCIFLKHFLGPRMDLFQRWPPKTCGPFQRGVLQQRSYLANPLLTSKINFFSVGK